MLVRAPLDLGLVIRARRKALGLDQRALADRVGVSRQWIVAIEQGKPGAELGLVLRTLRELDIQLAVSSPPTKAGATPADPRPRTRRSDAVDLDAIVERARNKRR